MSGLWILVVAVGVAVGVFYALTVIALALEKLTAPIGVLLGRFIMGGLAKALLAARSVLARTYSSSAPIAHIPSSLDLPKPDFKLWQRETVSPVLSSVDARDFRITVGDYPSEIDIERPSAYRETIEVDDGLPVLTETTLKSLLRCEPRDKALLGELIFEVPSVRSSAPKAPGRPTLPAVQVDLATTEKRLRELCDNPPSISPSESELKGIRGRWYRDRYRTEYDAHVVATKRWNNLIEHYTETLASQKTYNERFVAALNASVESYAKAAEIYQGLLAKHNADVTRYRTEAESFVAEINLELRECQRKYLAKTAEGVCTYFSLFLTRLPLPVFVPKDWELHFDPDSKVLLIDCKLLTLSQVAFRKGVLLKSGPTLKPPNKKELKALIAAFYPSILLRLCVEVFRHDSAKVLEGIGINGWVNHRDGATGQMRKTYVASMFTKTEALGSIDLEQVDPVRCFDALRGRVVPTDTFDVVAVNPVIQFNKNDRRFVVGRDVLDELRTGQNLAAIDWEEFEHLVRELFAKIFSKPGVEVRVTQASRDKGVDAVVFDPTPITGGKLIIQAKRYVNVVDVSSVRDLYGTLLNEGASKGILVTTSTYGADSYEFAKDKPIDLINGAELLGLLESHGYQARIDLEEARRMMKPGA